MPTRSSPPTSPRAIRALFAAGEPERPAWRIGIAEIFPGESRPHPWAYTLTPVRLYRRDRGRYAPSPVHDRVELQPGIEPGRLKGVIHHFSVRSLGDQLDKLNRYSDQQADDLAARGVAIPSWRVFVELPGNFLKAYLGRRHFVRGVYGFLTAMNYAISRHLRIAKHYERRTAWRRARPHRRARTEAGTWLSPAPLASELAADGAVHRVGAAAADEEEQGPRCPTSTGIQSPCWSRRSRSACERQTPQPS